MSELFSPHPSNATPPPHFLQPKLIPAVLKLKDVYGTWQIYREQMPKRNRYSLGSKIDEVFLTAIEYCFLASYAPLNAKMELLNRAISRIDLLKLLAQLAWEIQALDSKKYVNLLEPLTEVGRMLGGWKKGLLTKTSASK